MEQTIEQLAEKNQCIQFVLDNYDMLCLVHRGKTVLVVGERVVRVFPTLPDAFSYVNAVQMEATRFAMIECDGRDPHQFMMFSKSCSAQ